MNITFHIDEGDIFKIKDFSVPGNDILTEEQLKQMVPFYEGELYSKEKIGKAIEHLRMIWGEYGYIYADIEPSIQPNFEEKTVSLTLNSDLGKKIKLNRINIIGNQKTRDYVIRRQLLLDEGQTLTNKLMERSKNRVEQLGFFDTREGVNWKINKVSEDTADLDLILKEIKTGEFHAQIGTGGSQKDITSPAKSFSIGAGISDRNFLGTGLQYNLSAEYSRQDFNIALNLFQPWLFNRPIMGNLSAAHRKSTYEDFKNVNQTPVKD